MNVRLLSAAAWVGLWLFAAGLDPLLAAEEAAAPAKTGQPRLGIDEVKFDMGQLVRGDVGRARFTVRNTGDAPLHILHVKPG